jgi:hypothetical protein
MILLGTLVVWIALLAGVVAVLWRDVVLMERRVVSAGGTAANGLEIGAAVTRKLTDTGSVVVVFLGDTCDVCFDIAADLHRVNMPDHLVAVVVAHGGDGAALAGLLPDGTRVIRDAATTAWVQAFDVHVSPFAMRVDNGVIVAKGHVRGAGDVNALMPASAGVPAHG